MDYEYENALKERYEKLFKEESKKSTSSHQPYLNGSHHLSNGGGREPTRFPTTTDVVRNKSKIRPVDPRNLRAIQGLQARSANLLTKTLSPPQKKSCDNNRPKPPEGNKRINHTDSKELYNNDRNGRPREEKGPPLLPSTTRKESKDPKPKKPSSEGRKNKDPEKQESSKPKGEKSKADHSPPPNGGISETKSAAPSKLKIDFSEYKKRKTEAKLPPSEATPLQSRQKEGKNSERESNSSYEDNNNNKVIDFSASATDSSSAKVMEYLDKRKERSPHQSSNKIIDFGEPSERAKKPKSKSSHESHSKSSKPSETTVDFKVKDGSSGKKEKPKEKSPNSSSSYSSKDGKQHSSSSKMATSSEQRHKHSKEHSSEKRHHSKEDIKKKSPSSGGSKRSESDVPERPLKESPKISEEKEDRRAKSSSQGNKIIDFDDKSEIRLDEKKSKGSFDSAAKKKSKSHSQNEGSNKIVDFNDSPKSLSKAIESDKSSSSDAKQKSRPSSSSSSMGGNQIVDFDCSSEKKKKKKSKEQQFFEIDKNPKIKDGQSPKVSSKSDSTSKENKKRPEDVIMDKNKDVAKSKEHVPKSSPQNPEVKKKLPKHSSVERERKLNSPTSMSKPKESKTSSTLIGPSKQCPKSDSSKILSKPKGNIPNGSLNSFQEKERGSKSKPSSPTSNQDKLSRPDLKRKSDELPAFAKAAKLKRTESPKNGPTKSSPPSDPIKPAILPIKPFPGLIMAQKPPVKLHPLHRDYKKFQELKASSFIPDPTPPKSSKEKMPIPESFNKASSAKKGVAVGAEKTKSSNQSKLVPSKGAKTRINLPESHAFLEELNGNPGSNSMAEHQSKDSKSAFKVPEAIRPNGHNLTRPNGVGGRKIPDKNHIRNLENKPPSLGRNQETPVYVPTPKSKLTDKPGTEYDPMEQGKCFNPRSVKKLPEYVPTKLSELRGLRETSNLPNRRGIGRPREEPYCPMPVRGIPPNRKIPEYYPSNKRPPSKLPPIGTYYKKLKRQRIESSDEEEYDEEMADFIDDEPVEGVDGDYSSLINGVLKEVFNYDKTRFIGMDDDDDECMESSFSQQMKEEQRSARIGLLEDLEDMRLEEEEKTREAAMKKKAAASGKKQQRKSYGNAFIF